ncbi:DODA-type extradiol aromatic ring-opening family dioxygenase [Hydrogenophaga pseudoflava]|nr:class III extradiol ring-cleavage dioxygenase [Hydrogenophaga pseudoflava]
MRQPSYYLCHGGGPWPWLQGPLRESLRGLERGLQAIPRQLPEEPRAVLVVSAHWEEPVFTVTTASQPGMVYDYFGFPPETYAIRYPSTGSPPLAERVTALLESSGLVACGSADRGYDHGSYSVLQTLYPQAQVPVVQLSLKAGLDPLEHLRAGRALAPLRDEGVLIIGSGMSCHERGPDMGMRSVAFDDWLQQTLVMQDSATRWTALCEWTRAPEARAVHPREDHLIPLMVAAGAALEDPAECIYRERLMGFIAVSSYRFGECPE